MLEKRTRRDTPMTGWKKDVKFLKRSKSPIVLLTKVLRYCGGFLNAMDEADEGAPVFAKVKLVLLAILQIRASYVAKDHNNNWSSGNGDVELLMTLKVRSNMFWVQLVTGRRGKAANKKSYFDQVDPFKKVDPLYMEDGTNRDVESGGSGLMRKYK